MKGRLYVVLSDVRSTHNVGSILRTADGLGVEKVYLCGYTPYPMMNGDERLPHLSRRINDQIRKTALGAESSQSWTRYEKTVNAIEELRDKGVFILALEQTPGSTPLTAFHGDKDIALLVGNEVDGIAPDLLQYVDQTVEIAMQGQKESFNVSVAAAMAMFYLKNML